MIAWPETRFESGWIVSNKGPRDGTLARIFEALEALLAVLPENLPELPDDEASARALRRRRLVLRNEIHALISRLQDLAVQLDPIREPSTIFDPTDPETIGRLIANTLLEQPRLPLVGLPRFYGAGVYAIFYRGDFGAYRPIAATQTPIYVGKAAPERVDAQSSREQGDRLWNRLVKDHGKNIGLATNLDIADFECRYLVVKGRWQAAAESHLIAVFQPIWNDEVKVCYGFGKHGDDPARRSNTRSPWDTLHPGRKWAWKAGNRENPLSAKQIEERILEHYRQHPPRS
jgi:hypothetical protein